MRIQAKFWLFGAAIAEVCLAGCKPKDEGGGWVWNGDDHHGRYAGIGIYQPGEPWTKIVDSQQAQDSPSARAVDDQAIFVVIDSTTGEIRACGDLSGYCIAANPWRTRMTTAQIAPIRLTRHMLETSDGASVSAADANAAADSQ
jgi:hypothetical protein